MMVGVLLAAGASSRMGSPKPLVRTRGGSFLSRGIRHLWTACDDVIVVLGSKAEPIRKEIEEEFTQLVERGELHQDLQRAHGHGAEGLEVQFVTNPRWKAGMYESVRVGLREALRSKPDAVVLLPVDHPIVRPATIAVLAGMMSAAIAACAPKERKEFAYALVPRFRRHRGHPIALSTVLTAAIARDTAAENLSDAIRRNARLVGYIDVGDPGVVRNVNRRGD